MIQGLDWVSFVIVITIDGLYVAVLVYLLKLRQQMDDLPPRQDDEDAEYVKLKKHFFVILHGMGFWIGV